MVPSRVRLHPPPTPSKIVLPPYDFLPSWYHSKCIPLSPKVSFPLSYINYLFPVQGYVAILSVLFQNFRFNQAHITRISFLIILQLRCLSPINKWIVTFCFQLLQNGQELFELHITHMGIILNLYLKIKISIYLEGRMMLTIINLTKVFARGRNQKQYIFCIYKINLQPAL